MKHRLHPLPQVAYDKGKQWFYRHPNLHFFMHQTYCRLMGKYEPISYPVFMAHHWVLQVPGNTFSDAFPKKS